MSNLWIKYFYQFTSVATFHKKWQKKIRIRLHIKKKIVLAQ